MLGPGAVAGGGPVPVGSAMCALPRHPTAPAPSVSLQQSQTFTWERFGEWGRDTGCGVDVGCGGIMGVGVLAREWGSGSHCEVWVFVS